MRISHNTVNRRTALAEVYLDGQRMTQVIEADEEAGTLTRYVTGPDGKPVPCEPDEEWATETLRGAVVIVLPTEQEAAEFTAIAEQNTESYKK